MSAALRWDLTARDIPGVGRVAFLLPVVTEDMPPRLREAVARRRLATIDGYCPCGATLHLPSREARRRQSQQLAVAIVHASDCDASDDRIAALIEASR